MSTHDTTSYQFNDLKGKHVFITGGGSGIGASLTKGFLRQGAHVSFIQRSDASAYCDEAEAETGVRPNFIACDVSDIAKLHAAMRDAQSTHGDIDVLVNNAANDVRHKITDYGVEDWDNNHAVNLRPYFFTAQFVTPAMRKKGRGVIINYSSVSYMRGAGEFPAYVTANAGITGLTRGLARELGPDRIRVNAIVPGWVLTEKQLKMWATPEKLEAFLNNQCLPDHLAPDDMVGGTLFLASDASRMMTGQVLVIDGGVAVTG